jgi:hypothetical protein
MHAIMLLMLMEMKNKIRFKKATPDFLK